MASTRPTASRIQKTGFACDVTKRPLRDDVFSLAASESSIGLRNGPSTVDLVAELRNGDEQGVRDQDRRQHAERAPIPSFVTKSRPKNASPVTEIATVRPAKMTARPADAPPRLRRRTEASSCRSCL